MDEIVTQLLTYQTAILMIAATIGTWVVRKTVETMAPKTKKAADEMAPEPTYLTHLAAWWNEVGLHLIPVLLGIGLVFGVKELAPLKMTSTSGVALYGGICGWFSSTGYKILRRTLKTKTGVDLPNIEGDADPASMVKPATPAADDKKDPPAPPPAAPPDPPKDAA